MAFSPASLPASVRAEYQKAVSMPILWPAVVKEAVRVGLKDENVLTNIVFFLHHPERNGKAIGAGEPKLAEEWKGFRTIVKATIPGLSAPSKPPASPGGGAPGIPPPEVSSWVLDDTEKWDIKRDWGQDVVDWVSIPPKGKAEGKEFAVPAALRDRYKVVFVWKSAEPTLSCVANPKQRVQLVAMVRDDMPYWLQCFKGNWTQARIVQTAAETAVKDYRDYIVNRQMCPKGAYNRLVQVNKDVTYQMLIGLYQMLGPRGAMGPAAKAVDLITGIIKWVATGSP